MSKRIFLALMLAVSLRDTGKGQESAVRESEVFKTIESLGTGDPLRKQPLSVGDGAALEPKKGGGNEEQPPRKEKGPTEITALEATFDNRTHQAVFIGDVVVRDP